MRAEVQGFLRPLFVFLVAAVLSGCAGGSYLREGAEEAARARPSVAEKAARLADGEAALRAEKYPLAEDIFRSLLMDDPEYAEARLGLAETLLARSEIGAAFEQFSALEKVEPMRARARQGQGLVHLLARQADEARKPLEAAVAEDASLWRAWNALGLIGAAAQDWPKAEESYARALRANPRSPTIINNLGFAYLLQKKYQAAADKFGEAVALDPNFRLARQNQRMVLAWQGKYLEALSGAADPDLPSLLNDVGYIAMRRGDYRHAESYFVRAMELSPTYNRVAAQNLAELKKITGQKPGATPAR